MNKYPRLRTHIRKSKSKSGKTWIWYTYDQRPNGPEISLGNNWDKALEQWDKLHNEKPLTLGLIQESIDEWRELVLPTYENADTQRSYRKQLAKIEAVFGRMAWHEVTLPIMRKYLKMRSAKTQGNRELSVLSIVWSYAIKEGMTVLTWPANGIKDWKNEEHAREFEVTDALFNAIYQAGDQVLRDCMDIATTTGMRLTDARTVRMPVEGKLRFKSNKKGKHSFFVVEESPVLSALLARRGNVDCVTLLTTSTGRIVSASMLRRRYDEARKAAAVSHPHMAEQIESMFLRDCRKRAADLAEDDEAASKLLQHSSVALTKKHYVTKGTKLKAVR
jgi:hypothetical protein